MGAPGSMGGVVGSSGRVEGVVPLAACLSRAARVAVATEEPGARARGRGGVDCRV